ncbi:MAG: hypothetical protein ACLR7U_10115 [Ruthenibacterium lactatiformans]
MCAGAIARRISCRTVLEQSALLRQRNGSVCAAQSPPQVEGGPDDQCAALLAAFEELRRRRREGSKPKWKKPQS